jgi:hypothetical protein
LPDWKRLIVGDAFALDSRNPNFYRDMFLFVPFLLSAIVTASGLLGPKHDYLVALKSGLLALLIIALARERLLLVGASFGFVCVQSAVSFGLRRDPIALAVSILTGVACLLLFRSLKDYKPSYSFEKDGKIATILVIAAGGVCWFALFRWLIDRG